MGGSPPLSLLTSSCSFSSLPSKGPAPRSAMGGPVFPDTHPEAVLPRELSEVLRCVRLHLLFLPLRQEQIFPVSTVAWDGAGCNPAKLE